MSAPDPTPPAGRQEAPARRTPAGLRHALIVFAVVTALFSPAWIALVHHALEFDLHSHVLLIPVLCGFLLVFQKEDLPVRGAPARRLGMVCVGLAIAALVAAFTFRHQTSRNDALALVMAAYVCSLWAGCAFACGAAWMRAAIAPFALLVFTIPLPDLAVAWLERASTFASAEAAGMLFQAFGISHLRDGTIFRLPGVTIEVALECSGIRSTWVLFIASLFAAQMLLRRPLHRLLLIGLVIPLGIVRNGLRIALIAILCVEFGPHMIHSPIHKYGGPVFFALSLLPLFAAAWWLARKERHSDSQKT